MWAITRNAIGSEVLYHKVTRVGTVLDHLEVQTETGLLIKTAPDQELILVGFCTDEMAVSALNTTLDELAKMRDIVAKRGKSQILSAK